MHNLKTARTATRFAIAAYLRATRQAVLLLCAEMKEPECEAACAIGNAAQQLSPSTKHHVRELHFALYDCAFTIVQRADWEDAGSIFVTQRQQEQHVLHRANSEAFEFARQRLAHAA
jgi:hypothetical protein